jgi:3',5'-cyclic AMP phosphodiesterase CpdA
MSKYINKDTGEVVKVSKDKLFDNQTLSWWSGYWVFTKERTEFFADRVFEERFNVLQIQ